MSNLSSNRDTEKHFCKDHFGPILIPGKHWIYLWTHLFPFKLVLEGRECFFPLRWGHGLAYRCCSGKIYVKLHYFNQILWKWYHLAYYFKIFEKSFIIKKKSMMIFSISQIEMYFGLQAEQTRRWEHLRFYFSFFLCTDET